MKKKFSIRRTIILLSIILVYSCAVCFISFLAKKAVLEDLSYPSTSPLSVVLNADDGLESSEEVSVPNYYDKLERIENKAQIDEYGIFAPVTTEISAITTAPEDDTSSVTTTPPETTAQPTTPKAEETTKETTKATKKSTEKTTEKPVTTTTEEENPEVDVEDDDPQIEEDVDVSVDIDDQELDSNVQAEEDNSQPYDDQSIQDLLQQYYANLGMSGGLQSFPADMLYSGRSYRDDIVTIYDKASGRYVTDNAFDIVCAVTFNEIGASRHEEAIKAQAVAVYTYIKYYQQKGEYASLSRKQDVPQLIIDCVTAVDGLAMFYDGEYIMAAFSASTAGVTCSSENVWGGERGYLKSVISEFDHLDTKNYGRVTTYTADELKKKIESKTDINLSGNCANWIQILSYGDGGYVDKIAIDGHTSAEVSGKERELTAHIFRTYILSIRSTCFTVSYSNGVFTFVTYGYGHGVGMSQVGADLYAEYGGYTFDQILHHYYTDIVIQ